MPEARRNRDETPPEVKYGLLTQADYDALSAAMRANDLNAWGTLAARLCEDNVPLFGVLFLKKDPAPHIWKEWREIQKYPRILVRLPRGHAKALALDTPIPTPDGWKRMGDIEAGDRVFDTQGNPTGVWDAKPTMFNRPCYRVTFNDGTSIIADGEHLWQTKTKEERNHRPMRQGKRIRAPHSGSLRTTEEIRATLLVRNGGKQWKEYNHSIDVAEAWNLPAQDLLMDPYCLGAWLGDGHSAGAIVSSADEEVLEQFRRAGYPVRPMKQDFGWSISDGKRTGRKAQFDTFLGHLRRLGVLKNKHIPQQYLLGSVEQRMALLQGLMDTDGTCSKGGQSSFTTTLPHLADQVEQLVGSLGLIPHRWSQQPTIPGHPEAECQRAYTVSFITKQPVFRLTRKLERQREATKTSYTGKTRTIVSVEPVPSVPVRCIGVEAPDGMFLAGTGSIPTHNTDVFTFCALVHRICYSVIPNSVHEDPRVLAIFETRKRANDRMLSVRQLIETGGPGGLIGEIFRGAPTFPGGEPTPWANMKVADIARKFGEWNNERINLPHPRRLAKPDPNITSISPGEGSVGFHPRLVLADDVVGPQNAQSDLRRRTLSDWWGKAIEQVVKPYTRVWSPHTVFHADDLNSELAKNGTSYLMEMKALDRFPEADDFVEVRDEKNVLVDIHLTPKGETLKPLWGCPVYSEAECPAFDPTHTDPAMGGIMHRPVKDLILQWRKRPLFFASQYMHTIRSTNDASVKPWMLRFFCTDPNDPLFGKVSPWHTEWEEWRVDQPDAGLSKEAPRVALLTQHGVRYEPGGPLVPFDRSVHGWDLAFGRLRTNDRTVCARTYRTVDRHFFTLFDKGRWRHDQVWRKLVLSAVTDPFLKPAEVALEVDTENIFPHEVRKLMAEMGVQDRFRLVEIHRTKDKDTVFQNSGLPITMGNGFWFVDTHDDDAVMELLSVTAEQTGGHDDCLDAAVNSYGRIRNISRLQPGVMSSKRGRGSGEPD